MPTARHGDTSIEYVVDGDLEDVPLLLIHGLGRQLVAWDPELIQAFVDRGFVVIRFDNRDVGLTSKTETDLRVGKALTDAFSGGPVESAYLLSDMADDAVAVLDAVGVDAAHVVGVSMGAMIAQTLAIEHPERVRTLTSIMSTTGDRDVGRPSPDIVRYLLEPAPSDRDGAATHRVEMTRAIGSPEHLDEARIRAQAEREYDRSFYPRGIGLQNLAILASGSRTDGLRELQVPTLVIHGDHDKLVDVSGGERTAEVIPGAELLVIEGMGHDLPTYFWPSVIEAVLGLVSQAPVDR